jgi:alpha-tubulin suppressor-like RCC1 family protein
MIGVKDLIDELNTQLTNTNLSELEVNQLYSAINSLETKGVSVVETFADLPNPVANQGQFVYINSENRYAFSNGQVWDPDYFSLYLNLLSWGCNNSGQLGDNTTISKLSPVNVVGGFTDWISASAGETHTVGLRANGTIWAWGGNGSGQLGDATTINRSSPVSVVGGFTDWVSVSIMSGNGFDADRARHCAGLRANGTAWTWGSNARGQLGNNTTTNTSSPVSVVGGYADWVSINASVAHTVGVRANGTAWAWGSNGNGRLGNDTINNTSSPVSVVGGFTDWVLVSTGKVYTVGMRANGTAWAWGSNNTGQIGDNSVTNRSSPVSVVGGYTDWAFITAGDAQTLGVRANGTAWGWGWNNYGHVGDNTTIRRSSPVSVVGGFTDWVLVSGGDRHSAGTRANGTIWGWGFNGNGQLGDGTTISKRSPISVIGEYTDWIMVSAGYRHNVGVRG